MPVLVFSQLEMFDEMFELQPSSRFEHDCYTGSSLQVLQNKSTSATHSPQSTLHYARRGSHSLRGEVFVYPVDSLWKIVTVSGSSAENERGRTARKARKNGCRDRD